MPVIVAQPVRRASGLRPPFSAEPTPKCVRISHTSKQLRPGSWQTWGPCRHGGPSSRPPRRRPPHTHEDHCDRRGRALLHVCPCPRRTGCVGGLTGARWRAWAAAWSARAASSGPLASPACHLPSNPVLVLRFRSDLLSACVQGLCSRRDRIS